MKLVKSALSIALCSVIAAPAVAADVDFYGKANVTIQNSNEGKGEGSETKIKSNASRLGVKGSHKINDDLEVIFKAEFQINWADGEKDGASIDDRNQYLGLKGNFGEVVVGNNDSVTKQSQGKIDLFNDYEGDIKSLFKGENRVEQSITYKTPKYSGVQLGATYITEGSDHGKADGGAAYSLAATYGDAKLKKSNIYAGIGYDDGVKGYEVIRGTVQGKLGDLVVGGMLQQQKKEDGSSKANGYLVSGAYKLDAVTLKAQYQNLDTKGGDTKSGYSVGADYKLTKAAKLTAFYTTFDMNTEEKEKHLAVGMEYKF